MVFNIGMLTCIGPHSPEVVQYAVIPVGLIMNHLPIRWLVRLPLRVHKPFRPLLNESNRLPNSHVNGTDALCNLIRLPSIDWNILTATNS